MRLAQSRSLQGNSFPETETETAEKCIRQHQEINCLPFRQGMKPSFATNKTLNHKLPIVLLFTDIPQDYETLYHPPIKGSARDI
ncbi:hypothetical protein QYM36_004687 [Artemia franciscana]|uniref:Uncharacterized protein n=1 Tax=Artemia franciscana TaxID=6661 RepID=A0AA88L738_ARTSF|nr:hypothetical protein QYM36_004687 [Artemia franciscana]